MAHIRLAYVFFRHMRGTVQTYENMKTIPAKFHQFFPKDVQILAMHEAAQKEIHTKLVTFYVATFKSNQLPTKQQRRIHADLYTRTKKQTERRHRTKSFDMLIMLKCGSKIQG